MMVSALTRLLGAAMLTAAAANAHAVAPRDLADTILHDIEDAVDCAGCQVVLTALKGLALLGNGAFVDVLTEICDISGAEDSDVCSGLIAEQGPAIAQDIRGIHLGSATSHLFCITLLGVCDYPAVRPNQIKFPKPKPSGGRPAPSGKDPIQVAHISDTHVDLSYTTGASYNCTKPICCRPYTPEDAPGNNSFPAGPFGNHACDPPKTLEQNMFEEIESMNVAFSIFTGDVPAHDIWLVTEPEVETDLNSTYALMQGLTKVFPAVGNHDTAPVNLFATSDSYANGNTQLSYDTFGSDWSSWIGAEATANVDKYGAYSSVYNNKLRVISFNSIFYYIDNFLVYEEPMSLDPDGQLAWIVSELQAAEDAGQRAWLIAHVPTGSSDFFHDYSEYMDQIVNRYENTIAALFYGHTHIDQFELAYSDYAKPSAANAVAMSYIAPSMTPTSGSPSFRLYSVDPDTFSVLDFTQYFANITSPSYQDGPTWEKLYSAKEAYGSLLSPPLTDPAAELTPAFWHNVTELFESNDAVFQQYVGRQSRDFDSSTCTGDCKSMTLCGLRAAQSQYNCFTPSPGLNLGKRELGAAPVPDHSAREECEGSHLPRMFKHMVRSEHQFTKLLEERMKARA